MIHINMALSVPYWNRFNTIWFRDWDLPWKYKRCSVQTTETNFLIEFNLEVLTRTDCSGIYLTFGLFGYHLGFSVFDNRYWDAETNSYREYDGD